MSYQPPFTVSPVAISMVAEIAMLIECYRLRLEGAGRLKLRKVNQIKTIQSSLAIEGNTLSVAQVSDILEGRRVVAPLREIQEVRNAIATYDLFPTLNPYSIPDLLKAHAMMMTALVDEAGAFRRGGVGVFAGKQAMHIAPPAARVPGLMCDFFDWVEHAQDHLLIRSCVFHYEFEFIHPFADGNGRLGRLWQSLLLSTFNPVFQYLPVETIVHDCQAEYYQAINASTAKGDSGVFIEFMLQRLLQALKGHQDAAFNEKTPPLNAAFNRKITERQGEVLALIREKRKITLDEIGVQLGISRRTVRDIVAALRNKGVLRRVGAKKNGYWECVE